MNTFLLTLLLAIPLLGLVGCNDDDSAVTPTVDPPVIASVSPTGDIGKQNQSVTFSAVASGNPSDWTWSFDRGTHPQTSGEASPTMILTEPGTRHAWVRACNEGGCDTFLFTFITAPSDQAPIINSVQPTGAVGKTGDVVTFTVSADRPAVGNDWDFGGGGTASFPDAVTAQLTLGAPGTYRATVRSCIVAACSDQWQFTYTVASP